MSHPEKLDSLKNDIENGLIQIQDYINSKKRTNQGISFISELFLEELLNKIYKEDGFHFKNMNHEIPNYPAIDIADENKGISYQVTVTNDSYDLKTKVNKTLEMFYAYGLHEKYNKLYILIISGIQNRKKLPQKRKVSINGELNPIKPELFSQKNIIDLTDFAKSEIFKKPSKLEKVLDVILKTSNRPEKKNYSFNIKHTYIERTVYDTSDAQNKSLLESIKDKRLNVLLGVGGIGKTTETIFISNKVSNQENYFCFVIRLINYANSLEELINTYFPNWKNVPSAFKTFIIFDGLDEVNSLKFDTASNEIKLFAVKYPSANVLVTCRTNFNPFISSEDSNEGEKFNELYLNEINLEDIKDYIYKECSSPETFFQAARESKMEEILKNPFYLVNAVAIFNFHNIIPKKKSDFYKKLIEQRIGEEKKKNPHFKNNLDEFALIEGLKILALTMQYSGEYKIEKIDFERIVRNKDTRENIKRIFFNEIEDYWQFEHNNFQEFLAAKAISELNWEKIEKIILLPNGKLKPKWLNAFSFLVNLVPENSPLKSWFAEKDIESLIKVEPDKIEPEIRDQIFIEIFEKHKREETVIWKVSYSTRNLCDFIKLESNDKVIKFLIAQITFNQVNIQSVSNAVHILEELEYPVKFENEIQDAYFKLLTNKRNHKYGISYSILNAFTKWKMFSNEIKNKLIQIDTLYIENSPLSSLCHFLIDGKFTDINSDLVYKIILAMEKDRVIGSEHALFELINLLSTNELINLIKKLTPNESQGSSRFWIKDLFRQINNNAIKKYYPNSKFENTINEFIYSSVAYHNKTYAKEFKSFYEKTNIVFKTFKSCFLSDLNSGKSKRREFFTVPALLANEECLDWLVKYYLDHNFSDGMIRNFLIALSHIENHDGYNYFMNKIKEPTKGRFVPKPNPYEEFNKKKEKLCFKAILNKESTLKYLKIGFKLFKNEIISRSEITNKLFEKDDICKDIEQSVGLEIISWNSGETINKQEFLQYYSSDENWENIVIEEYRQRIAYQKLPEENQKWIRNWLNKILPDIKFKGALQKKGEGEFTFLTMTYIFLEFALLLDFPLEEKKILEITTLLGAFDFDVNYENGKRESHLYNYLIKHSSPEVIQNQLLQNLKEEILIDIALDFHIRIIKDEKIIDAIPLLPEYIINSKIPKYIRNEILDFYVQYNGNVQSIQSVLNTLTLNGTDDYFDWNVINLFIQNRLPQVVKFLKDAVGNKEKDQLKIGIHLLKAGQQLAFKVITKNLRMIKNHSEDVVLISTINDISLKHFDSIELFRFLKEILEINTINDFGKSGFNDILPTIFNKIFELITKTSVDESFVLNSINEILNSCNPNETSRKTRYEFYDLQNRINIHNDKGCQISDAIKELKELEVEYEF